MRALILGFTLITSFTAKAGELNNDKVISLRDAQASVSLRSIPPSQIGNRTAKSVPKWRDQLYWNFKEIKKVMSRTYFAGRVMMNDNKNSI